MIKKAINVTFRIEEDQLRKARQKALKERRSLNQVVNQWIRNYTQIEGEPFDLKRYVEQFKNVRIGRTFTREERNER